MPVIRYNFEKPNEKIYEMFWPKNFAKNTKTTTFTNFLMLFIRYKFKKI